MTGSTTRRSIVSGLVAGALLAAAFTTALAQEPDGEHPVVGRWNVVAEPGGSVWAFQPSGVLVASGPGEIISEGTWSPAAGEGEFDAHLAVGVSGQELHVLGAVAPDGAALALYITASDPARPDDWTPWPAETRLLAPRFGLQPEESPAPSAAPVDCLRPEWSEDAVDWDRCDTGLTEA